MILKCGRDEFELTGEDIVFFNGAVYSLMTRKVIFSGQYFISSPTVAKGKMTKMIKDGTFVEVEVDLGKSKDDSYKYYKLNMEVENV